MKKVVQKRLTEYIGRGESKSSNEEKPGEIIEKESIYEVEASFTDSSEGGVISGILLSVGYNGSKGCAYAKLYNPESKRLFIWYDDEKTHRPYLLTNLSNEELEEISEVKNHKGLIGIEEVEKYDPLRDQWVKMTKVVADDPLSIGGKPNSLRELLPKDQWGKRAWEAKIRYHHCFTYDNNLIPGMPYVEEKKKLQLVKVKIPENVKETLFNLLKSEDIEYGDILDRYLPVFLYPVPHIDRVAIDIEVFTPELDRIPDSKEAEYNIISAAFASTDGLNKVFVLKRVNIESSREASGLPSNVEIIYFDDEKEMVKEIFNIINQYPIVVTFNGDNFDLRYLYHRAIKLGFKKEEIPIELTKDEAHVKYGVHIDLYKFFYNSAIKVYAFGNAYKEVTLDTIAKALLGMSKIEIEKPISELSLEELAHYNYQDAKITLDLTTFNDNLTLKLIILLMRISRLPMEDLTRQGVSSWVKSLFYAEHRIRNYLIPRPEEISGLKGTVDTTPIIKGKKYKGAIVVEPKPGVHFNVVVLDFASLYPSVIKKYNLSYETVRCVHPECRDQKVPETNHWVCKKRRGLTSQIIGFLRDIRVRWFKPMSKNKNLPDEVRSWYSVVQQALKVFINASYGVFGAEHFPFFCLPVAECLHPDSLIQLSNGLIVKIKDYARLSNSPLKSVQLKDFKITDADPQYVIPKRKERAVHLYAYPYSIIVSPEHKIFVADNLSIKEKCADEIVEGDLLVGVRRIRVEGSLQPFPRFRKTFIGGHVTRVKDIKIPEYIDEKVAQIVGYLEGDGTIYDRDVRFFDKDLKILRFYKSLISETFQVNGGAIRKKNGSWYLSFSSKNLANTLNALTGKRGKRRGYARVPKSIQLSPINVVRAFLRGVFDAEGTVSTRNVSLSSADPLFLEQIRFLLLRDGIITTPVEKQKRGPYLWYRIHICDRHSLKIFAEKISFSSEEKSRKLFRVLKYFEGKKEIRTRADFFPLKGRDFYRILRLAGYSSRDANNFIYGSRFWNNYITRYQAKKLLSLIERVNSQQVSHIAQRIRQLLESDLIFCKVSKKKILNNNPGEIFYDLTVPETNNFIANGLLVHNSTTAIGRYAILKTIEKAKELGVEVVYGDTDSVFLKEPSEEKIEELIKWSREELGIELDVDKVYRYLALSQRKKNYLGVFNDGSVDIKGLTGKKRNTPIFLQKAFMEVVRVLGEVKSVEDFEKAKEKIREIAQECYRKLEERKYSLEELAFKVQLTKPLKQYVKTTPQHVKAARMLAAQGKEIRPGDIITFVKTRGVPGVKPVQYASIHEIDVEKYKDHIRTTFEQILDALGIDFSEIVGIRSLDMFI